MDVRIGVTYTPRELELELADDVNREQLQQQVEQALSGQGQGVLWLTDKRGRHVGVPSEKIAYIEIGSPHDERRVGFGTV